MSAKRAPARPARARPIAAKVERRRSVRRPYLRARPTRRLGGLRQAGVDLGAVLPQSGRTAAAAHEAVTANTANIGAEGTGRWVDPLRRAMPQGRVLGAVLASPAWPDITPAAGRFRTPACSWSRPGQAGHGGVRRVSAS